MKSSTLNTFAWITLLYIAAISCNKNSSVTPVSEPSLKTSTSYSIRSVMDFRVSPQNGNLDIIFYESQRMYTLPATSTDFQAAFEKLKRSKEEHLPLRVNSGNGTELKAISDVSKEEMVSFVQRFNESETDHQQYEEVIPGMNKLNEIFAFIQQQNCEDGNLAIDYCIPFQYVIDGCYARAHKMREILQLKYGYDCSKIFSFSKNFHPLAVDAGDCCVFWSWHDAPLVKVNTPEGIISLVVDPSLFDHPVSIQHWLAVQSNESCDSKSGVGHYEVLPGSYYFSDGTKDPKYIFTNFILKAYKNLETCN